MIKRYAKFFRTKTQSSPRFIRASLCLCVFAGNLVLFSCNKPDEPEPTGETPVFYIKADISADSLEINAGENNYYMFSSYTIDSNDVINFSSQFKQTDCSACTNTLKISFTNNEVSGTVTQNSFPLTYLPFLVPGGIPTSYSVKFIPLTTGGQPQSYLWNFGDGTASTEASPTHVYTTTGIYEVDLHVQYVSGCSSSISNPLNLGVSALSCDAGFIISSVDTTTVMLTSSPGGTPPFTYAWNMGDGTTATTANVTHTYDSAGVYQVCLTSTSSDGCTNTRCLNVATENPGECSIRYSTAITTIENPFNLSTVIVEWVDENGTLYTSDNPGQSPSSYFKLNSVEDYDNNENGQKTKKLNLSFSCVLFNGSTMLQFENAEAVIAIAYP